MKTIEEIKQFYDEATIRKLHGFIYSNTRVEYAWQSLNTIFDFILPKHVLEIGSGIGEISFRLSEKFPNAKFVGFDISEESIKIANSLFHAPNLTFVKADSLQKIDFPSKGKYDIVFLMDVYEHISIEERNQLHQFIKEHISKDGFIFLSCPTSLHQSHLRKNVPTEIQPIDEEISLKELMVFSEQTSKRLIQYKEVSAWSAGDYFHAIFSNYLNMQSFSDFKIQEIIQPVGLKKEILKKLKTVKKPKMKEDLITRRKEMIRNSLGIETLEKIEAYK